MSTYHRSAIGWGVALVAFGVVLLLRNAGAIPDGVRAWPWALLAAGLVLLIVDRGRDDLIVPAALIAVGGVFALREAEILPVDVTIGPVLLIAGGGVLLYSALTKRTTEAPTEADFVELEGATSAMLVLAYGAGTLKVRGGAARGLLYDGSFVGGARHEAHRTADRLQATVRHERDVPRALRAGRPLDWDVALTTAIPLDVEVRTGASRVELDLTGVKIPSLKVSTGASDVNVVLPERGRYRVRVEAGAAEVSLRVPDGVAASIRNASALASVTIDTGRFPKVDRLHRSVGYEDAEHRAEIEIEGGVASFSVR